MSEQERHRDMKRVRRNFEKFFCPIHSLLFSPSFFHLYIRFLRCFYSIMCTHIGSVMPQNQVLPPSYIYPSIQCVDEAFTCFYDENVFIRRALSDKWNEDREIENEWLARFLSLPDLSLYQFIFIPLSLVLLSHPWTIS